MYSYILSIWNHMFGLYFLSAVYVVGSVYDDHI